MTDEVKQPITDAWLTADPNEPTWTVQGGDPVGPSLLQLWAQLARIRASEPTCRLAEEVVTDSIRVAMDNRAETKAERIELLKRATRTEEISWDMKEFQKGDSGATGVKTSAGISVTENDMLDLWDAQTRACVTLSQMRGELRSAVELLKGKSYSDDAAFANLALLDEMLIATYNLIQFREDRKLASPR
jgi:hypothetical protein